MYGAMCESNCMKTLHFRTIFRGFWVSAKKLPGGITRATKRRNKLYCISAFLSWTAW